MFLSPTRLVSHKFSKIPLNEHFVTGQTNYACHQYISNVEGAAKVLINLEAHWLLILDELGRNGQQTHPAGTTVKVRFQQYSVIKLSENLKESLN